MSTMQLAYSKVAQPKLGAFLSQVSHWYSIPIRHECQTARLMPGKYSASKGSVDLNSTFNFSSNIAPTDNFSKFANSYIF